MPANLKNAKIAFVTLILMPLILAVFVASVGGIFIRSVFGPVISVLSGAATESPTPIEPSIPYVTYLALVLVLFVGVLFAWTIVMWRKTTRSKNTIQSNIPNGTAILEPDYLIVEDVEFAQFAQEGCEEIAAGEILYITSEASQQLASDGT